MGREPCSRRSVLISWHRMAKSRRGLAGFLPDYQCFSFVAQIPHD